MAEARTFNVAALGVKPTEVSMLDRAFRLSQFRPRVYRLLDEDETIESADLAVVDGNAGSDRYLVPVAKIVDRGMVDHDLEGDFELERPLLPNRVLKVLDRLTVEAIGYAPELSISDNMQADTGIYEALKNQAEGQERRSPGERGRLGHLKVLVVDDSMLVQRQMELILSGEGIQADFASDGASAVVMQREKHYDLVFLDVMMPGMDGFQTCKALRKSGGKQPLVVMLTSKGSAINRAHGVIVGASAYLTKPATRDSLMETLTNLMNDE